MIEVSALHAGENGYLDISCHSTIPDYPMNHEEYADVRKKTVSSNYLLRTDNFMLFPSRIFAFHFYLIWYEFYVPYVH